MSIATRLARLEQDARRRPDEAPSLRIVIDGEDDLVLRGPPARRPATRPHPRT